MIITTHNDADGISAGYLYSLTVKNPDIHLNEFGTVEKNSEVVLDMHPESEPNFAGLVIDHHPNHPVRPKYKLLFDTCPASVVVFKNFKDKIPKEKWWIVVVGAVGDMEAHSIPTEIWDMFPILRKKFTQLYGWKHMPYSLRVYQKLSSGLNALSRMGQAFTALEVLEEAESPLDIITDSRCEEARETLKQEANKVLNEIRLIESNGIIFGSIQSDCQIEGRIATQLSRDMNETVCIQNFYSGGISIRGDLANWLETKLKESANKNKVDLEIGGHPQAKGGTVEPEDLNILDLLEQ